MAQGKIKVGAQGRFGKRKVHAKPAGASSARRKNRTVGTKKKKRDVLTREINRNIETVIHERADQIGTHLRVAKVQEKRVVQRRSKILENLFRK